MNRGVLLLANDFPPIGGAGVQRAYYFAKYLPRFAWKPIVVTVKDVAFPVKDATLLKGLPPETDVVRTESFELRRLMWLGSNLRAQLTRRGDNLLETLERAGQSRRLRELGRRLKRWCFVPDDRALWAPFATSKALRLICRAEVKVVLATVPSYSTGVIGYFVSRMSGVPLVLDLRDPWTMDPYHRYATALHEWLDAKLERTTVNQASKVVVISRSMEERFRHAYPRMAEDKLVVITNGYDSEAMATAQPVEPDGRFVVAYVGSLYAHHLAAIRVFLRAWTRVAERNQEFASMAALWLVGRCDSAILGALQAYGDVAYEAFGYLPHAEGLGRLKGASALLLLIKELDPDSDLVTIPGKLFEYLAAGPPVLLIGPSASEPAAMIRSTGGRVHAQDDESGIARTLEELFRAWSESTAGSNRADRTQYSREFLTGRLAEVLDACVDNGRVGGLPTSDAI